MTRHPRYRLAAAPVALLLASGVAATGWASAGSASTGSASTGSVAGSPARVASCPTALPQGAEPVRLRPECFVPEVTNRWFPLRAGTRWVYRETGGDAPLREVVVVTRERKQILGIAATVVRDTVTDEGRLVEDTRDWYAQDRAGAVWYLGEDTKAYEDGVVSTEGSWQAGVHGAQAGVIMPAHPRPGQAYRQEYAAGVAEDRGRVLSRHATIVVPAGSFRHALLTRDDTPLEPGAVERKYYASGVGLVAAAEVGGPDRTRLIAYTPGTG